jgi:integrase
MNSVGSKGSSSHRAALACRCDAPQTQGCPIGREAAGWQSVARQRPTVHHRVRRAGRPAQSPARHRDSRKAAGVDGAGVHTLRHSAAVAWLEGGVHIKAVADLLGHSSIAITGDVYGHTSDDTARAAVDGWTGSLGL